MASEQQLHIAIIPDGNRRWAKNQLLDPWEGHRKAIENFRTISDWCRNDDRIGTLTVWCFSTENWKRNSKEIAMLMEMLESYLQKERATFLEKNTRFVHSGRKDKIPETLAKLIAEIEEETLNHSLASGTGQAQNILHLAIDYGGKDEVVRSVNNVDGDITEETIQENLDHPELPDIDLIIRTSGETRTSNFFLWQSVYAEWMFINTFFPDFSVEELSKCIDDYASRMRRFGE